MITFKAFLEEIKKVDDEHVPPAFLKKQAGPPLTPLDKLKIKTKLALGQKPALLKRQAESYE